MDPFDLLVNDLPDAPLPETPKPPSSGFYVSPEDRDLVVRTVWGEARGGPDEELQAVAAVIRNRAALTGKPASDIVLEKGQFEPWMNNDTRRRMMSLTPDSPDYQSIAAKIDPILNGEVDPTGGATHFYAPIAQARLGRRPPSWDDGTGQFYGRQKFFRHPYGGADPSTLQLAAAGAPVDPFDQLISDLPSASDPFDALVADLQMPEEAPQPYLGGAVVRGQNRLNADLTLFSNYVGQHIPGMEGTWNPDAVADKVFYYQEQEKLSPPSQTYLQGQQEVAKAEGFLGTAGAYLSNPSYTASAVGELLPQFEASILGVLGGAAAGATVGAAGGPIGAAGGGLAGAAVGSGFGDAAASMREYIIEKVNPQTPEEWKTALRNDALMQEAMWYGVKHGGAVGAMDLVGMKLGGKIASEFLQSGASAARKASGVGLGLVAEGATEGTGEALGQYIGKGEVDMKDVYSEVILGMVPGTIQTLGVEPALNYITQGATPDQAPTSQITPEEAGQALGLQELVKPESVVYTDEPDIVLPVPPERQAQVEATPVPEAPAPAPVETPEVARRGLAELFGETLFSPEAPVAQEVAPTPEAPSRAEEPAIVRPKTAEIYDILRRSRVSGMDAERIIHQTPAAQVAEAIRTVAPNAPESVVGRVAEFVRQRETRPAAQRTITPPKRISNRSKHRQSRVTVAEERSDASAKLSNMNRGVELQPPTNIPLWDKSAKLGQGVFELARKLGMSQEITINFVSHDNVGGRVAYGSLRRTHAQKDVMRTSSGRMRYGGRPVSFELTVGVDMHDSPTQVWATMTHELGHAFLRSKFFDAPTRVKQSVLAGFRQWRRQQTANTMLAETLRTRDNVVNNYRRHIDKLGDPTLLGRMDPTQRRYWLSFNEYMAEMFAKWATTSDKPITVADKWFQGIARMLRNMYAYVKTMMGAPVDPNVDFKNWLDGLMAQGESIPQEVYTNLDIQSATANAKALQADGFEGVPVPRALETVPVADAMSKLFGGKEPPEVKSMVANLDQLNWLHKYGLSLQQLAKRFPDVDDLQRYREDEAAMRLEVQDTMTDFGETIKHWNDMSDAEKTQLNFLLEDYSAMTFRTPEEVQQGVIRKPTQAEFAKMVKDLGVSNKGVAAFVEITRTFDKFMAKYKDVMLRDANAIQDPEQRAIALATVEKRFADYAKIPYFPWMRFGDYVVVVKNAQGNVVYREHGESKREQAEIIRRIQPALDPGDTVHPFKLQQHERAFVGMPPGLLEKIGEKLGEGGHLSTQQREHLEQTLQALKFEYSPAQSFKHRFRRKSGTPGFRPDQFQRAFAAYGFYGSRHLARVKYADMLRGYIKNLKASSEFMPDGNLRSDISNFMLDHFGNVMNPKSDFAWLRSATAFWYLGWNPASAALNLSQTFLTTYPYLASKFGDVRALGALTKAATSLQTYYKKGTILEQNADRKLQMLGELVRLGLVSEAQAPELAAISEDRNMLLSGRNPLAKTYGFLRNHSMLMFSLAEQANRRWVARAALDLASANPGSKYVKEQVRLNQTLYKQLQDRGWSPDEAAAIVTTVDAINTTQFEYAREAQPRFMRGHARAVFAFKTFQQNMLFFLMNPANRGAALRSMLIMGFLGGMMGLPGAEDLQEILKSVGWIAFGKDWDLEKEARKFVVDTVGDEWIGPDAMVHGMAKKGFGIPAILDALGGTVGMDVPYPTSDRSNAIGLGNIIPVPFSEILGPGAKTDEAISKTAQQVSGAAFGMFYNMYRGMSSMMANGAIDAKDAEKMVPRSAANLTRMFRYYNEGGERDRSGAMIAKFDWQDPDAWADLISVGAGYQPLLISKEWDLIRAKAEATAYWDARRSILLRQAASAFRMGDQDKIDSVVGAIKTFNSELPPDGKAKAITKKTLENSFRTRERLRAQREAGVGTAQNYGIEQGVERLYPLATEVEVRPVR